MLYGKRHRLARTTIGQWTVTLGARKVIRIAAVRHESTLLTHSSQGGYTNTNMKYKITCNHGASRTVILQFIRLRPYAVNDPMSDPFIYLRRFFKPLQSLFYVFLSPAFNSVSMVQPHSQAQ